MQCGDGTLCCGAEFQFDFTGIDPAMVRFYAFEGTRIILVVYIKDGTLFFSISFDCGKKFHEPKSIVEIRGIVKDIQILASEDKFVVAFMESIKGQDSKRAISGVLDANAETFVSRECVEYQPKGREIINVALGIRKMPTGHDGECETVDYVFIRDGNTMSLECQGHG
jgi:hypothetical protein